jgi:RNA-directed DNA polymerase
MKRVGHLLEQIATYNNLMAAFQLARRGCGNTPAVCRFFFHLEPEILRLQQELLNHHYQPGAYRYFKVYDPKERTIAVAPFRDRVVHHAIVRVLAPIYEQVYISDSYATRTNKGTHRAILRVQHFLRGYSWYLKSDIEKYFERVDHEILMMLLKRKIKDRLLINLLDRIVHNAPEPGKGLPIGNLTSQFLANVYLDPLDHLIKDRLRVGGYVRYMDDLLLLANTREELVAHQQTIEDYLGCRLALSLKPSATWINRSGHGISFLGMRIFPGIIRVKPENRRRSLKRLKATLSLWRNCELDEDRMINSAVSIIGHLRYFCPKMPVNLGVGAE